MEKVSSGLDKQALSLWKVFTEKLVTERKIITQNKPQTGWQKVK